MWLYRLSGNIEISLHGEQRPAVGTRQSSLLLHWPWRISTLNNIYPPSLHTSPSLQGCAVVHLFSQHLSSLSHKAPAGQTSGEQIRPEIMVGRKMKNHNTPPHHSHTLHQQYSHPPCNCTVWHCNTWSLEIMDLECKWLLFLPTHFPYTSYPQLQWCSCRHVALQLEYHLNPQGTQSGYE